MKNILNIDTTTSPIGIGYMNEGNCANEVELKIIIPNLINPSLEITNQDGTKTTIGFVLEFGNEMQYNLPIESVYISGDIYIRITADDYASDYVNIKIPDNFTSEDDVFVKKENDYFVIKKLTNYKYTDLPIATTSSLGAVIIGNNLKIDEQGVLSSDFPIGSIYVSSTSTNPKTSLGGEWELIDKEFAPAGGNATFTRASSSSATLAYARSGHNIYCRLQFTNSTTLSSTSVTIGTIDVSSLGVADLTYAKYPIGQTNSGNALLMMFVNSGTGVVQCFDVIGKGSTNSVASGNTCWVEWTNTITMANMLDSACNKFYWKRTA